MIALAFELCNESFSIGNEVWMFLSQGFEFLLIKSSVWVDDHVHIKSTNKEISNTEFVTHEELSALRSYEFFQKAKILFPSAHESRFVFLGMLCSFEEWSSIIIEAEEVMIQVNLEITVVSSNWVSWVKSMDGSKQSCHTYGTVS